MNNIQTAHIIKSLCKERGLTIKSLLEQCGIGRSFMYDLEKKNTSPSVDKLEKIADHLNCSVDYLLGRVKTPEVLIRSAAPLKDGSTIKYGMDKKASDLTTDEISQLRELLNSQR